MYVSIYVCILFVFHISPQRAFKAHNFHTILVFKKRMAFPLQSVYCKNINSISVTFSGSDQHSSSPETHIHQPISSQWSKKSMQLRATVIGPNLGFVENQCTVKLENWHVSWNFNFGQRSASRYVFHGMSISSLLNYLDNKGFLGPD